jgi:hypothetical protein
MLMNSFPDQNFMQMCWVVPDVHEAIAQWTRATGAGPFFYFENVPFEQPHYRGRPTQNVDIKAAIGQSGGIQIELVSQADDLPSIWRDIVPVGKSGLHHMALYCQDMDANIAAYRAAGAEAAFNCMMMGARTYWMDTTARLGFMVELIEANPIADQVFGAIRGAAQGWDGTDPVRTLG